MNTSGRYLLPFILLGLLALPSLAITNQNQDIGEPKQENFRFYVLSERCFKQLTEQHTLDFPCLKITASKLIGFALVYFSILLKLPQIYKIVSSKSAEGLSYMGFFVELLTYSFSIGYNWHFGNPFSTYGENVFLTIQGIILVVLIRIYDRKLSSAVFLLSQVLFLAFSGAMLFDKIPENVYQVSMIISIVLLYFARCPQILLNLKNKSTGQLSFITTFVSWAGCIARTLTILVEVNDLLLITLTVSATVLNGLLVLQFLIYWNSGKSKTGEKRD